MSTPSDDADLRRAMHRPRSGFRWRRLVGTEDVTQPIPMVQKLRHSPYQPRQAEVAAFEEQRRVLELLADIGAALTRAGSGTAEIVTSIQAGAVGLGVDENDLSIDIAYGTIMISLAPKGEWPATMLRVTPAIGRDYTRLSALHGLVTDLAHGTLGWAQAREQLDRILAAPRPYRRSWVTVAWGAVAASVVIALGGSLTVAVTAFLVTALVDRVGRWANRHNWPDFFVTFAGASLAALSAVGLAEASQRWPLGVENPQNSSLVVAGGIIVLLAGSGLVAAVQDGLNGHPVTATGRMFNVLLTTSAIIAGVGLVLTVARRLDLAGSILLNPLQISSGDIIWYAPLLAAVTAVGAAIGGRSPLRLLFVTGLAGTLGYATAMVAGMIGAPEPVTAALGCTVIGCLGRVWALARRASPLAVVAPAITSLLPGLSTFQGLQEMAGGNPNQGLLTLLGALTTGLAVAAGCVLGDALAAPLQGGMDALETARDRTGQQPTVPPAG